jgi:hypothetical protein
LPEPSGWPNTTRSIILYDKRFAGICTPEKVELLKVLARGSSPLMK